MIYDSTRCPSEDVCLGFFVLRGRLQGIDVSCCNVRRFFRVRSVSMVTLVCVVRGRQMWLHVNTWHLCWWRHCDVTDNTKIPTVRLQLRYLWSCSTCMDRSTSRPALQSSRNCCHDWLASLTGSVWETMPKGMRFFTSLRKEDVITRLRIGSTRLARDYLLHGEPTSFSWRCRAHVGRQPILWWRATQILSPGYFVRHPSR